MSKVNFEVIVAAVKANNNRVVDDHNNSRPSVELAGLAMVERSGIPVALCESRYFSLNRVYLDDKGVPHVSQEAVAGAVMKGGFSMREAIEAYNANQEEYNNGYFTVGSVVLF